jgi:hypothetical protein
MRQEDQDINLWYSNHAKTITADGDLRRLGLFCKIYRTTPQEIVALGKPPSGSPDAAKKWIIGKVADLQTRGYKGNYIANFVKSLVSWLEFSEVHLPPRPPIHRRDRGKKKKYRGEKPPTQQELQILLGIGDPRQKVAIALIAFAGVRPRTIGNYRGDDGLRISDFTEMHVDYEKRTVRFEVYDTEQKKWAPRIPTLIRVREEINKGENREYITFLNKQGYDYIQLYLEDRMTPKEYRVYDSHGKPVRDPKSGEQLRELRAEKLTPDSPIIGHNHPYRLDYWKEKITEPDGREVEINYYKETWVPAQNISYAIISPVIQTLGLKLPDGNKDRSYILRSYFADQIMRAESDKHIGVIYSWRQCWMGHNEGIEAVYTTEHTIPEEIIEQMRKAYQDASDTNLTVPQTRTITLQEASNEYKRMFLVSYKGWTDEEVYRLGDLSRYTFQQLNEMENKLKTPEQTAEKLEPKIKRIIVSERDLKKISKYLDEGYQPVDKQHQVIKGQIILEVLTIPQMTG